MHFTYDANGTPLTVTFDYVYYMDERTYDNATGAFVDDVEIDYTISDTYYYITNIQGDVIELLKSNGESAGYYRYDAWGDDVDWWEIEEIICYNPLLYRGYFYDRVSGYYYLQTRFYDPSVGRFISADAYVSTGQGVLGYNMFAYCNNNPVMYIDPSGQSFISTIISLLIVEEMMIKTIAVLVRYIKPLSDDEKVLIATIAAEATVTAKGTPVSSQGRQAMANVALNRVNSREWSQYDSVAEICAYTGFDGYGSRDYYKCMEYLENRNYRNITYEAIIWDVMKAYVFDITGGCQLYYTPAAMIPEGSVPYWDFSQLVEESILGVDSYYEGRFFRYK